MGKIFQYTLLFIIIISIGYAYNKLKTTKAQVIPVPFEISPVEESEITSAENAQILIIGDHSSETLKPSLARIFKGFDGQFKNKIKIFDWTRPYEGVHRTFHKVSALKNIPPIVIYLGGSSEFYEKLFEPKDVEKVKSNFDLFNNEKIKSLVMISKFFGQIIYKPVEVIKLEKSPLSQRKTLIKLAEQNGTVAQMLYELHYLVFNNIFQELVNIIKFKGSSLISLTIPVKVTNPPRYVCDNSVSQLIIDYQVSLNNALEKKQTKKYFSLAKNLTKASVGNAKSFHLFARFNESLGRTRNALYNYRLAHAFDCLQEQSNYIINQIIKKTSLKKGVHFFDFDEIVHRDFGLDFIFLDQYRPQEKYILEVETLLGNKINELLKY